MLYEVITLVRSGRAPVALAGGAEATIAPTCIAGFQAMFALSRRNDDPTRARQHGQEPPKSWLLSNAPHRLQVLGGWDADS